MDKTGKQGFNSISVHSKLFSDFSEFLGIKFHYKFTFVFFSFSSKKKLNFTIRLSMCQLSLTSNKIGNINAYINVEIGSETKLICFYMSIIQKKKSFGTLLS